MEMTTIYIWGTIGALLCLVVGAMLGYARQEAQQVHANALQRDHLQAVDAKWRVLLTVERNVVRELEISVLSAGLAIENETKQTKMMENQWRYADKFRKALVEPMVKLNLWDFAKHGDDPNKILQVIIDHAVAVAFDPKTNQKAKNLHTAGVRKGAKRGRLQMQKLMQKSIDNQALTINGLQCELFNTNGKRQIHREAVLNVLDDKVALPSVRKSIKQAIIVETGRLLAIAAKKRA